MGHLLTPTIGFDEGRIAVTPEVSALLSQDCPVALGVSGGKDGSAAALATYAYLNAVGHAGPRVLIHADLGAVEWRDSLPSCRRVAEALGAELVVVSRAAGGLMERWETRWANNVARYKALECVRLILPWSTASMRFCTSELKTQVICADLSRRFPGRGILSVTGIRREESPSRAKAPVVHRQTALDSRKRGTWGLNWNPIIEWTKAEVFAYLRHRGIALHEAYAVYNSTRVSCAFCILGSQADLVASAFCEANQPIYLRMVDLEILSAFSFQDRKWLGDVAPHLLSGAQREGLALAKRKAHARLLLDVQIPKHLLFVKGRPSAMPTPEEANLLAAIRYETGRLMGFEPDYVDGPSVLARFGELMA